VSLRGGNGYGIDNKNVVLLVSSSKLLQRKKERLKILCLNEKSFIVFMFFFCVLYKRESLV
jgi:hypothetical protein